MDRPLQLTVYDPGSCNLKPLNDFNHRSGIQTGWVWIKYEPTEEQEGMPVEQSEESRGVHLTGDLGWTRLQVAAVVSSEASEQWTV